MLTVLDLFSGIGGFALGLDRTGGFKTVGFCEIDPFCRKVLAKHWPDVPIHDDVRTLEHGPVDVVCGGFPCQDISLAGSGAGIDGERSGLWSEYARIVGEVRPRYVIVENVSALLGRGFGRVLGDLATLGYDAEWHCIPASAVNQPIIRDRVWIIAEPHRERLQNGAELPSRPWTAEQLQRFLPSDLATDISSYRTDRADYGLPNRMDRLKALGNSVVPQVVTMIGNAILEADHARQ